MEAIRRGLARRGVGRRIARGDLHFLQREATQARAEHEWSNPHGVHHGGVGDAHEDVDPHGGVVIVRGIQAGVNAFPEGFDKTAQAPPTLGRTQPMPRCAAGLS